MGTDDLLGDLATGPARLGAVRLIAIDGPSGSGKSVLADRVVAGLRAGGRETGLVRTDDFATWDDPVSWWPRLVDGVLTPLAEGRPGGYRRMEWVDGVPRLGAWVEVGVPDVLVLEGVSAGRRSVRARLSRLIWCEVADPGLRLERAVARDGEACRGPLRAWQRFEAGWFAVDGTREAADVHFSQN
ncbi:MAG TPA: uridine kinase [Actinophytocola sp.]|uniref:uridine kinase family protein n=1 Tax=Actinophytocola sp. TaxID=1872138 RepID=UPI002DDD1EFD|nr:uridine kinase [Actinophytocola sp.]HEV2783011.1 uridine kinase [Actinophytocola sp.]